jgi:serine/threonine-protein kinase RsbW
MTREESGLAMGEVRLEVPASPEFFRITRMMAAGVASRVGFTLDEVEDLRIAIDELCFALIGRGGRPGTLTLQYALADDALTVRGVGAFTDGAASDPPVLSPLSAQILRAVVDECEVWGSPDGPSFKMVKRLRAG